MLDYIERKETPTKYANCHTVAIIDRQAMKCRRYPLELMLKMIPQQVKEGTLRDTDILYIVPVGKEYHTTYYHRIKNDKFTATISDGEFVVKKRGSIIPLLNWVAENTNGKNDVKVTLSRFVGHKLED